MNPNTIYCGDCVAVMRTWEPGVIDLTVTSPPYSNLRDYKGFTFDFESTAQELFRVTKVGGIVVWVVGDAAIDGSESGESFYQALYFKEIGFRLHDTMIYEKQSPAWPSSNRYGQVFEYMFVLSKGKPKTANIIKDKENRWGGYAYFGQSSERRKDGTLKKRGSRVIPEYSARFNIWRMHNGPGYGTVDKEVKEHPASFPEQLAFDHIQTWSNEGEIVLDPFLGSGTTGKMALLLGRNFVGIELAEDYCALSKTRIEKYFDGLDIPILPFESAIIG